ncbi:MAG: nucleoside hydrolase [Trueperaceae bacterium]|nr:nucleoside hydrolase [Trueperaceae bacterium]
MSARPRVLIDCDPGHDDAFALLFAARTCELVAISTVSGNVGIASTTRNALIVRDLAGLDVPVHRGAAGPLVGQPLHAPDIHGDSGLDGPVLPSPRGDVDPTPAAIAIVEAAKAHHDLWLVPTGPLTNVALAMRLDPELPRRIAGISLMGGSRTYGNTTAAAEFNILADPEAADVVFSSGARIVMAGLDLTHQFRLGRDEVEALHALGSEVGVFASELLGFFLDSYQRHSGRTSAPMHDPCAVLALTDPELFEREPLHVAVELRGVHTRGMTLCDQRDLERRREPNTEVLVRIDAVSARERLHQALAEYSGSR